MSGTTTRGRPVPDQRHEITTVDWYVAAPGVGRMLQRPGLVHAKRTGTLTTACGRRTDTWTKLFDERFVPGERSCPACSEVVGRTRLAGRP